MDKPPSGQNYRCSRTAGGIGIKHKTWLTTNELQEAAKALKMVRNCLEQAGEDQYHWKWVLVALHNCLQGFMVCALKGENGEHVFKDGREEMDTFLNLYKKIKSDKILLYPQSKKFIPRGQQDRSIRKINQLRNHFIHFKPKSWFLELNCLPGIAMDGTDIIEFLVFASGNIGPKKEQLDEIRHDLDAIEQLLLKLDKSYS